MPALTKTVELGPSKNVGTAKKPKIEYLEPRLTVELRVLNAEESMIADDFVGESSSQTRSFKTYAFCSIRKINGKPVNPLANAIEFKSVVEHFDLFTVGALVREFQTFAMEAQGGSDPKGSSAELPSEKSAEE